MKRFLLILNIVVLSAFSGFAQEVQIGKTLTNVANGTEVVSVAEKATRVEARLSAWQAKLQADGLDYIQTDRFLSEQLAAGNWTVTGENVSFNTVLKPTENLAVFSDDIWDKLITVSDIEKQLPGFEKNFPSVWKNAQLHEGPYSVILNAAYGEDASFFGTFVSSFSEVLALEGKPIAEELSAIVALRKAVTEGEKIKSGFLTIAVQTPEMVLPEVLVLDVQRGRFISVPQSRLKGKTISRIKRRLQQASSEKSFQQIFEEQGLSGNK